MVSVWWKGEPDEEDDEDVELEELEDEIELVDEEELLLLD
jgi:hypothetical protein